jgi:hypothetical protein
MVDSILLHLPQAMLVLRMVLVVTILMNRHDNLRNDYHGPLHLQRSPHHPIVPEDAFDDERQ